ncbi:hypothetical protein [uncultured Sphingomonas sp.]|uniref:hypothetical protein n=1 Tax=uncultured Sphingomonas sp. TaxID=158754 RepID=UPI0025E2F3AE|nr:hypothetical protein [uncultured Sphingomonas sp.]
MLTSMLTAWLLAGPTSMTAVQADQRSKTVQIGSSKFRVTVASDGIVTVVNKALLTGRNMDVRDKMRLAVTQATGCELRDEMWFDAKLRGKLLCSDGSGEPLAK